MELIPDLVGSNKNFWPAAGIGNSARKECISNLDVQLDIQLLYYLYSTVV